MARTAYATTSQFFIATRMAKPRPRKQAMAGVTPCLGSRVTDGMDVVDAPLRRCQPACATVAACPARSVDHLGLARQTDVSQLPEPLSRPRACAVTLKTAWRHRFSNSTTRRRRPARTREQYIARRATGTIFHRVIRQLHDPGRRLSARREHETHPQADPNKANNGLNNVITVSPWHAR